ncbi:MAG: 1,4-alpha-glucan branching protein GlgB [Planctomycetaceae bacterium]|nr:1,4-alpha-glucan branching protein GlgB [Planctomycetaceae bacterium]
MQTTLSSESIGALIEGRHETPYHILGPHPKVTRQGEVLSVRAFLPHSTEAWVVDSRPRTKPIPMSQIHPAGLFEAICPKLKTLDSHRKYDYMIQTQESNGKKSQTPDPYSFPHFLTDFDLYLLGEGTHWDSYEKLGAHLREIDGIKGVNFAVWAPNAAGVNVVGEFNSWDGRRHPMQKRIPSGVWEIFIPNITEGMKYKFQIRQRDGVTTQRTDPYGFYAEVPPCTASVVADLTKHSWKDAAWLEKRADFDWQHKPLSIYEVHLGSWRRPGDDPNKWLSYRDLAHQLVDYVREMGYSHIELMPIAEHPLTASWGYQITGYYAVTSRYGTPEDFMYFVDLCHQNDIGVLLDWVPAHFPKDGHGLRRFDGTALYEHADPRQGEHQDWGTCIFNYGRNEVKNFLISNALFWLDKYHIDGLRVDAVASMLYLDYSRNEGEWVPNEFGGRENLRAIEFIKKMNEEVHLQHKGVLTIAEESTAWAGVSRPTYTGGLGFSMKWNMGWMNDTLRYMRHDPIHRKYHHDELTFSLIYAFHENFILPISHDEVVHGKQSIMDQVPGDLWQKFANTRLLYSFMWTHPGKKLQFMGNEFGQWREWDFDSSLDWHLLQYETHQGLRTCMADLNRVYRKEPALHEVDFDGGGFEWIDCHNWENSVFAFLRYAKNREDFLVVVANFTPVPRKYRLGVPECCYYEEIFCSDDKKYWGGGMGNAPGVQADNEGSHFRPAAIDVAMPPLGVSILKPRRQHAVASR